MRRFTLVLQRTAFRHWIHDALPRCQGRISAAYPASLRHKSMRSRTGLPDPSDEPPLGSDILDGMLLDEEDLEGSARPPPSTAEDEQSGEPASEDGRKAGPLARKMWNCAKRGVRSEEVWAKFSQRVLMTGAFVGAGDVTMMFFAFARIKYRDKKALDTISPFILRHINDFTVMELALLLNAHKKLEYERIDSLQLLLTALCGRPDEWSSRVVALAANAVAYFYIYEPRFWKLVTRILPTIVWKMNPLEISNVVSAMARVDRRETNILLLIARMCRRCAERNLFSQETLATTMNAFAKLDFNHHKLSKAFEDAAIVKLDHALSLGPDYRKSSLRGVDVFDVQALVLILHTLVCLVGTSDDVIVKLLTLVSWSCDEVSNYQCRVLKNTCHVLRRQHRDLVKQLSPEIKQAMYVFEHTQLKLATFESRWSRDLRQTLRKMDIVVELKALVDDQVLDIWLPTSKAAVVAIGPYAYYAGTTHRTAYSKLHQRLLEMEGHTCMVVPYYEWSELKTEEDKMVFLWSLGRRAASRRAGEGTEAAPTVVLEDGEDEGEDEPTERAEWTGGGSRVATA
mmetsp:Transcript_27415/g.64521  ORF Transcript_27415/g.64521 Transcript_27415/m.64521 type:complete len:569 (+) Transcript_27415:70-1776(+)